MKPGRLNMQAQSEAAGVVFFFKQRADGACKA